MTTLREFFVIGHLKRFAPHLQKRYELADAYQRVFGNADGRLVLSDILKSANLLDATCEGESAAIIWGAGRRSLGAHIIARLRWSSFELANLARETTHEEMLELDRQHQEGISA
ncbi:MAG TPA: hypothetical protein VGR70_09930 [Stellaceae bacterium]|nr:hypothetical protein [Stellaceae bacterium]